MTRHPPDLHAACRRRSAARSSTRLPASSCSPQLTPHGITAATGAPVRAQARTASGPHRIRPGGHSPRFSPKLDEPRQLIQTPALTRHVTNHPPRATHAQVPDTHATSRRTSQPPCTRTPHPISRCGASGRVTTCSRGPDRSGADHRGCLPPRHAPTRPAHLPPRGVHRGPRRSLPAGPPGVR